jgi:hypothetical protein
MMRIRKIVDWRKYEKFRNFGIKKLLWSKMKIEREREWKLQGGKNLDEKGGRRTNMNEKNYNEKHKLTIE